MPTTILHGTTGDDGFSGTTGDDNIFLGQGGEDSVSGLSGVDGFYLGGALDAGDALDGGHDFDRLYLNGDYSLGVTMSATTFTNFEAMHLLGGFAYDLTLNDANVAAGQLFDVHGRHAGSIVFDASADTDAHFNIRDSAGNDTLSGGGKWDRFALSAGTDTVYGGGGTDRISVGASLTAADHIDGGTGNDTVRLNADYTGGSALVLGANTIVNVENLIFAGGHNYDIATDDGNVAGGGTLNVDGSALSASDTLSFDGSAETDGAFSFLMGRHFTAADSLKGGDGDDLLDIFGDYSAGITMTDTTIQGIENLFLSGGFAGGYTFVTADGNVAAGASLNVDGTGLTSSEVLNFDGSAESDGTFVLRDGAAGDVLKGGAGADTIDLGRGGANSVTGGGGADDITCGGGADTLIYLSASESNSTTMDVIHGLDLDHDTFDTPLTIGAGSTAVTGGSVSASSFDTDMGAILSDYICSIVNVSGGDLIGKSYLVINADTGDGFTYHAGDYVIDITGYTGTLDSGDFI